MKNFAVKSIAALSLVLAAHSAMATTYCTYGNSDEDSYRMGHGATQQEAMVNLYVDCYREFSNASAPVRIAGKAWCTARVKLATCATIGQ